MINHCDYDKVRKLLETNSKIIITTHVNPDGDAIGSALALFYYLKLLKKDVKVINYSPTPKTLSHLDINNEIIEYDENLYQKEILEADLIIVVDLNETNRLKTVGDAILLSKATKLVIDHHLKPKEFADYYYIGYDICATGFLIWKIINNWKVDYNKEIADAIYTSIITDTGNFRFDRTTPEVHRATAELIEHGADPSSLYNAVFNQHNINGLRLLGIALSDMELHYDNKMCIMKITDEKFRKTNSTEEEIEGFVANTLSIAGVKVGILMTEVIKRNEVRVSFRSKENYFIRDLANKFGGGGHSYASGARVQGVGFEELKKRIIIEAREVFA